MDVPKPGIGASGDLYTSFRRRVSISSPEESVSAGGIKGLRRVGQLELVSSFPPRGEISSELVNIRPMGRIPCADKIPNRL